MVGMDPMDPIIGRFDPDTTVVLLRSEPGPIVGEYNPPRLPKEGATVVETATADATGSVTFVRPVSRTDVGHRNLWVRGFKDRHPIELTGLSALPFETAVRQIPIRPDRARTPLAPDRTSTSGGAS